LLGRYGINRRDLRVDGTTGKGYRRSNFEDAWQRFCPLADPSTGDIGDIGDGDSGLHVARIGAAMERSGASNGQAQLPVTDVADVTEQDARE
jgi:hypothetical protein